MTFDEGLLPILVCPLTRTPLRYDRESQELVSEAAVKDVIGRTNATRESTGRPSDRSR